jgi:hypothetical protein
MPARARASAHQEPTPPQAGQEDVLAGEGGHALAADEDLAAFELGRRRHRQHHRQ